MRDDIRILLIEDRPGDARLIEELLSAVAPSVMGGTETGGLVHETRLADGVRRLSDESFDVLLLDLNLPDSDGIDTLSAVRQESADLPIVVLTGMRSGRLGVEAIGRGAQEYLRKEEMTGDLLARTLRHAIERKERERQLVAFNDVIQRLSEAKTPREICEIVVSSGGRLFDLSTVAVARYDEETGDLRLAAGTDRAGTMLPDDVFDEYGEGSVWEAFLDEEPRLIRGFSADGEADGSTVSISELLAVPLDRWGVLLLGSTTKERVAESTHELAKMLGRTTQAAIERAKREQTLHEREAQLREKNTSLSRLNRISSILRGITQAVIRARTRVEIEQEVCDRLSSVDPYRFVWIGDHDEIEGTVTPRAWAGMEGGYLDHLAETLDDEMDGDGPIARAMRTGEPAARNVLDDVASESWRREALSRGYRSYVAIPIRYGDTFYGVLNVYASRPDVFTETERTVLGELGDTIAHGISALERKRALVSTGIIELEFSIADPGRFALGSIPACGGRVELETVMPRTDGSFVAFVTVRGVTPERVVDAAGEDERIREITHVTTRDGAHTFECTLADSSLFSMLLDHGAVPRTYEVDGDDGTLIVELPDQADVRGFVEMVGAQYPGLDLVARHDRDEVRRMRPDFRAEFERRLTDRQFEILRTAYFSGYFEWPREKTKQEVAELLGVTQPTVNRHLRTIQRVLFEMLLED